MVDILAFVVDKEEGKRYLRQLVEFGYLEPQGGNKNRTYIVKAGNIHVFSML